MLLRLLLTRLVIVVLDVGGRVGRRHRKPVCIGTFRSQLLLVAQKQFDEVEARAKKESCTKSRGLRVQRLVFVLFFPTLSRSFSVDYLASPDRLLHCSPLCGLPRMLLVPVASF
jgi:hypothetical protein